MMHVMIEQRSDAANVESPETFDDLRIGTRLEPGTYLLQLSLTRPISRDKFIAGLTKMGLSKIIVDDEEAWGHPSASVAFIAVVERAIQTSHASCFVCGEVHVRLSFAHICQSSLFEDLTCELHPYELIEGGIYELRFLTRRRSHPKKEDVLRFLGLMGWGLRSPLCVIKRNMHIKGKPNTEFAQYHVFAKWLQPSSYITAEEPFYFEDVLPVWLPPSAPEETECVETEAKAG